jgi:hypothetical protein
VSLCFIMAMNTTLMLVFCRRRRGLATQTEAQQPWRRDCRVLEGRVLVGGRLRLLPWLFQDTLPARHPRHLMPHRSAVPLDPVLLDVWLVPALDTRLHSRFRRQSLHLCHPSTTPNNYAIPMKHTVRSMLLFLLVYSWAFFVCLFLIFGVSFLSPFSVSILVFIRFKASRIL